jgi:hypothetical protein
LVGPERELSALLLLLLSANKRLGTITGRTAWAGLAQPSKWQSFCP